MVVGASVEEAIASSSMSRLGWSLVVGHSVVSWGMRRPEIATVTLRPPLSVASTRVESIFRGVSVAAPDRRPSRKRASAVGARLGCLLDGRCCKFKRLLSCLEPSPGEKK